MPSNSEISIHAPREGCDFKLTEFVPLYDISIHAPREGCDPPEAPSETVYVVFQSTHPVRGATAPIKGAYFNQSISIHAPREGCDSITLE